jgi:hypothetical protein
MDVQIKLARLLQVQKKLAQAESTALLGSVLSCVRTSTEVPRHVAENLEERAIEALRERLDSLTPPSGDKVTPAARQKGIDALLPFLLDEDEDMRRQAGAAVGAALRHADAATLAGTVPRLLLGDASAAAAEAEDDDDDDGVSMSVPARKSGKCAAVLGVSTGHKQRRRRPTRTKTRRARVSPDTPRCPPFACFGSRPWVGETMRHRKPTTGHLSPRLIPRSAASALRNLLPSGRHASACCRR